MIRLVPTVTMLGGLLIAGCASTAFSQLDGNRYYKAAIDTYPVAIVKVDDASELRNPVYIEPGVHRITVQAPPGGAHRYGDQQTITLDVKPCTRYWLVAVKDGPLASKFAVKVDHEEAIGGCRPSA